MVLTMNNILEDIAEILAKAILKKKHSIKNGIYNLNEIIEILYF